MSFVTTTVRVYFVANGSGALRCVLSIGDVSVSFLVSSRIGVNALGSGTGELEP